MDEIRLHTAKTTISSVTIVAPTGVSATIDINIPNIAQKTEKITDVIVTFLKLLKSDIADIAGKITRALIKSEPTSFIARTIMTAITTAKIRL